MFRNIFGSVLLLFVLLPTNSVFGENRIGVGVGALYNGIGLNFSRSIEGGLVFGSVGCLGISTSSGRNESDGVVTATADSTETNCGIGFGYASTKLFSSRKHAIGTSVGLNYNTGTNGSTGVELSVIPNYVYFFNGVENRGLNLGVGGVVTYADSDFENLSVLLNIGFHF